MGRASLEGWVRQGRCGEGLIRHIDSDVHRQPVQTGFEQPVWVWFRRGGEEAGLRFTAEGLEEGLQFAIPIPADQGEARIFRAWRIHGRRHEVILARCSHDLGPWPVCGRRRVAHPACIASCSNPHV
jgi:hypothetical protein